MKPILLDTFCGAGGCTKGYQEAGFYVVGVDINPQPHYIGDEFYQADALEFIEKRGREFDAIHASPMCQKYSLGSLRWNGAYLDQIPETRRQLKLSGKPYVIENVPRAPLVNTITLCGIQFGLNVIRHRKFEANWYIPSMPHVIPHPKRGNFVTCAGHGGNGSNKFSKWCQAMDIDWMTKLELAQAIPWQYTAYIGGFLIDAIGA